MEKQSFVIRNVIGDVPRVICVFHVQNIRSGSIRLPDYLKFVCGKNKKHETKDWHDLDNCGCLVE